jgi:hypothetical protein
MLMTLYMMVQNALWIAEADGYPNPFPAPI